MERIYSSAICDLLWLGEDTGLDDDVASVLESEIWEGVQDQEAVDVLINCLLRQPRFEARLPKQLQKVFDVPTVWSRIWIVQEVVLARDVQVLYWKRKFTCETLRDVCFGMTRQYMRELWFDESVRTFNSPGILHTFELLNVREQKMRNLPFTLSLIWDKFGRFGATDPRDRIFGILGFLQEDLGVRLDYTKRPEEIFCEVTRRYVSTTGDLNVLLLDLLYVKQVFKLVEKESTILKIFGINSSKPPLTGNFQIR